MENKPETLKAIADAVIIMGKNLKSIHDNALLDLALAEAQEKTLAILEEAQYSQLETTRILREQNLATIKAKKETLNLIKNTLQDMLHATNTKTQLAQTEDETNNETTLTNKDNNNEEKIPDNS